MFSYIIKVFEIIMEDGSHFEQRYEVTHLLNSMKSFNFAFNLNLVRVILGFTNDLA